MNFVCDVGVDRSIKCIETRAQRTRLAKSQYGSEELVSISLLTTIIHQSLFLIQTVMEDNRWAFNHDPTHLALNMSLG